MRFQPRVIVAVLAVALAGYALDCAGMNTAEQAVECCKSMRCALHGHSGEDCCKSMPSVHAVFDRPSSVPGVSWPRLVYGRAQALHPSATSAPSCRVIAEEAHAPPFLGLQLPVPLRI